MTSVCSKHRHRCAFTAQMIMLVDSVVWAKTICLLSLACLLPYFTMSAFLICSLIYEGSLNQGINSWRVCKVKNIIFQDEPNIATNIYCTANPSPVSQFSQGKTCFHCREPLFSLQGFPYKPLYFPVRDCSVWLIKGLSIFLLIYFNHQIYWSDLQVQGLLY